MHNLAADLRRVKNDVAQRHIDREDIMIALDSAADLLDSMGWIKCEERMPEPDTAVSVVCKNNESGKLSQTNAKIMGGKWFEWSVHENLFGLTAMVGYTVLFWQPLPEMPEGK